MCQIKNTHKMLFIIYAVSVLIGMLFVWLKPLPYTLDTEYDNYARNILAGNGFSAEAAPPYYPDVYRVPGYSIFLSLIYRLLGINHLAVMLIQVFLNAAVCIMIFYISKRYFDIRIAYASSIAVAIYPFTAVFVHVVYSEILCIFLFSLGILLFEKARASGRHLFFVLSGAVFGYCLLVRPGIALFPLFVTIACLWLYGFKKIWKQLVIFNLSVLLIWSPWVIRNYAVTHKFIPLTIEGHEMLYWASGSSIGKYFANRTDNPEFHIQMQEIHEKIIASNLVGLQRKMKIEDLYMEYTIKNIMNNPFLYSFSLLARVPRLWISAPVSNDTRRSYGHQVFGGRQWVLDLIKYFMVVYSVLALYGIWALRRRLKECVFLPLPLIYFSLTHMFIAPEARFTLPARPFVLIFTIVGLCAIFRRQYLKQH